MSKEDDRQEQHQDVSNASNESGVTENEDIATAGRLPIRKDTSRKKTLFVVVIIIAVGLVIALALWYWFGVANAPKANDKSDQAAVSLSQDKKIVEDVSVDLAGTESPIGSSTAIGGQTESGQIVYEFAPYKVEGKQFKSLPNGGAGRAFVSNQEEALANIKKLDEGLKGQGFKQVSTTKDDAGAITSTAGSSLMSYAIYASDSVVCALSHTKLTDSEARIVGLGCSPIANYEKTAQAATPIHEAYAKSNPSSLASGLVYAIPDIKEGANGKKRAIIFQKDSSKTDGAGIYYYYSVSDEWKFLAAAPKAMVNCSIFNTQDIKEAFRGIKCYENTKVREL